VIGSLLPLIAPDEKLNVILMPRFMSLLQKMISIVLIILESGLTAVYSLIRPLLRAIKSSPDLFC
jgi:hypothetical protein